MRYSFYAWIRFLRFPNGLTVPGDVLAGAVLQTGSLDSAIEACFGVLSAYWFGMALNDLVDLPRDRKFRPERPLPSGLISLPAGWMVCLGLGVGAFVLVPSGAMAGLLALIIAYTLLKEPFPGLGPVLMALCRVAAIWIGAGGPASPSLPLWIAFGVWFFWIWLVTFLARREALEEPPPSCTLPVLLVSAVAVPLWAVCQTQEPFAVLPFALIWGGAVFRLQSRLRREGRVQPAWIGNALRLLLPLQSLVLAGFGAPLPALVFLVVWPLLAWLSRQFPMS